MTFGGQLTYEFLPPYFERAPHERRVTDAVTRQQTHRRPDPAMRPRPEPFTRP